MPAVLGQRLARQLGLEPGARTAWHTHPLGQTLIVTSGLGDRFPGGYAVGEVIAIDREEGLSFARVEARPLRRSTIRVMSSPGR